MVEKMTAATMSDTISGKTTAERKNHDARMLLCSRIAMPRPRMSCNVTAIAVKVTVTLIEFQKALLAKTWA